MQRLVYSPAVSAYVDTETGVVDLTDFITAGSVNRVLNEVSTAELTIRNPQKMFTQPGNPTFRPMDGITIFASRYRSKPVQLFTGYLDATPYLQLFPGVCTIRASCTLKRLLHTYWDAGLPHTLQFLTKFGWMPTGDGGITSPGGQTQSSGMQSQGGLSHSEIDQGIITDGSIGNLLFNVLFEIGNWRKDQILIEKLPNGIIKSVSDIMQTFEQDDKETKKELEDFFKNLIGDYGGGPSGASAGGTAALTGSTNAQKALNFFVGKGVSAQGACGIVGSMMAESGGHTENIDPTIVNSIGATGICQWLSGRLAGLHSYAQGQGKPWDDLAVQLGWCWAELNSGYRDTLNHVVHSTDPGDASYYFVAHYEIPGAAYNDEGVQDAQGLWNKYGQSLQNPTPTSHNARA